MKKILFIIVFILLQNCMSNYYSTYYTDVGGFKYRHDIVREYDKQPKIYLYSQDREAEERKLLEAGYLLLGYSSFNASELFKSYNKQYLLEQADALGASIILADSYYTNTQNYTMALPEYEPGKNSTTYIYGDINAIINTTTSGSLHTKYVPYTVNRFNYYATFWAKTKPKPFGAYFKNLTDALKQKLERNKGVQVEIVVNNSPAYNADIVPGDIIISINNIEFANYDDFILLLEEHKGEEIILKVFRNDTFKDIKVQLNN